MANLFNRAAIFTDLHLGHHNNEKQFNEDCFNFIKWFVSVAKSNAVDSIIFLGDFFHNRNSIHLSTLNYSVECLEMLDSIKIPVYFILGNHDIYFKESRRVASTIIAKKYSNITVFNNITSIDNVMFCPWLVADEWKRVIKLANTSAYVFGHFELPHFLMNASVEMPEHEGLKYEHFDNVKELVFTGHFHKRQSKGKVLYMGNAFPHNFGDAWDDERGMILLDWGKSPVFLKWPDAPNYRTQKMTELLDAPEISINEKTYARITVDLDLPHNEIKFIKDIFEVHFSPRKLDMIFNTKEYNNDSFNNNVEFQSVDQIVIEGLKSIDSVSIDKSVLIDVYHSLNS